MSKLRFKVGDTITNIHYGEGIVTRVGDSNSGGAYLWADFKKYPNVATYERTCTLVETLPLDQQLLRKIDQLWKRQDYYKSLDKSAVL